MSPKRMPQQLTFAQYESITGFIPTSVLISLINKRKLVAKGPTATHTVKPKSISKSPKVSAGCIEGSVCILLMILAGFCTWFLGLAFFRP